MLAQNPLFGEQPPAAVAIWDRLLAYGTAVGVAQGVIRSLPLGAESERQVWSSVGGRWRLVRVRYPALPPGYGRHPAAVAVLGVALVGLGAPLLPLALTVADLARESFAGTDGGIAPGEDLPLAARAGIAAVVALLGALSAGLACLGAWMVAFGLGDLISGRSDVTGRVLRRRERARDKRVVVHLAVDDGTRDRVRAWRLAGSVPRESRADGAGVGPRGGCSTSRDLQVMVDGSDVGAGVERATSPGA